MINLHFLKSRFISILIFLLVTLQPNTIYAAEISGTDTGSITEDVGADSNNLLKTSGKLTIIDPDINENAMVAATVVGKYGKLTQFIVGNWRYVTNNSLSSIQNLNSGETLTDTLAVSSVDGTRHNIVITINGTDELKKSKTAAVISGTDTGSLIKDVDVDNNNLLKTSGTLKITDPDNGENIMVAATVAGKYGSLKQFIVGNWRYVANNGLNAIQNLNSGETLTDILAVSSVDGTRHNIVITITGTDTLKQNNTVAVISGTDTGSLTKDADVDSNNLLKTSGTLKITDPDDGENIMVAATVAGKYGSLKQFIVGNWRYIADNNLNAIQNLNSGETLTDTLQVSSVDGTQHNIVITINGTDGAIQSNAIILSWTAPSIREDNSPVSLSEIAGYNIYYGTTPGDYINTIDIDDGSVDKYTIDALPSGTYYFVITTVDTEDRESLYSLEMIKTI